MKIVLIAPCDQTNEWKNTRSVFVFPPLALACLAAVTPSHHTLICLDETLEEIDLPNDVDLIGITIHTPASPHGFELADRFRAAGHAVVLGGIHVTLCPDECLEHADAIVIGEGERAWPQLLEDFENGQMKQTYSTEPIDLAKVAIPDHSIFTRYRYRLSQTVMATRGCPFQCSFCATATLFGKRYRTRPVQDVIREIAAFPRRFFIFLDDNLFFDRKYARELMQALIPLKKYWVTQAAFTVSEDEQLLRLARKAGCMAFLLGFETVSQANFHEMGKPVKSIEDYKQAIGRIHDAGILIQGSFIFGFDGDTPSIFQETLDFVQTINLDTANFCILTPIPGTPIFEKLDRENRILTKDWSKYTRQHVVFQPKNYSLKDLRTGRLSLYKKFYSLRSMLKRMPLRFPHIFWFWIYNLSFRRGIRRAESIEYQTQLTSG
ncbi:B12-binding domain-containing radical SAM protein [bacterium]|nr:B12-binding domain-containing radical SAM protein [bacterium]